MIIPVRNPGLDGSMVELDLCKCLAFYHESSISLTCD